MGCEDPASGGAPAAERYELRLESKRPGHWVSFFRLLVAAVKEGTDLFWVSESSTAEPRLESKVLVIDRKTDATVDSCVFPRESEAREYLALLNERLGATDENTFRELL